MEAPSDATARLLDEYSCAYKDMNTTREIQFSAIERDQNWCKRQKYWVCQVLLLRVLQDYHSGKQNDLC